MGSMGGIGNVDVKFQASTGEFTASVEGMSGTLNKLRDRVLAASQGVESGMGKMTAAAEKARYAAMMAGSATEAGVGKMTAAHERLTRGWQRELIQQERAEQATQALARAQELAALKARIQTDAAAVRINHGRCNGDPVIAHIRRQPITRILRWLQISHRVLLVFPL